MSCLVTDMPPPFPFRLRGRPWTSRRPRGPSRCGAAHAAAGRTRASCCARSSIQTGGWPRASLRGEVLHVVVTPTTHCPDNVCRFQLWDAYSVLPTACRPSPFPIPDTHSPAHCAQVPALGCVRCAAHCLRHQGQDWRMHLCGRPGRELCQLRHASGGCHRQAGGTQGGRQWSGGRGGRRERRAAESSANCIMPLDAVIDRLVALKVGDKGCGG